MSMHSKILALKSPGYDGLMASPVYCAEIGHKDARHAAAEIAAEGDALIEELAKALKAARDWVGSQGCRHEQRHRGGAIWTICDDCGKKWADDRGGFKPYRDPAVLSRIDAALAKARP